MLDKTTTQIYNPQKTSNILANEIIDESTIDRESNHGCRHVEVSSHAMDRKAGRNTSTSRPRNPGKPEQDHFQQQIYPKGNLHISD